MSKSRKNQFTRQAYPSEEDKVNAAEAAEDVNDKDTGAEADKPAFCALSGMGVLAIGIGLLVTAVLLAVTDHPASFLAFAAGFAVGLGLLLYAGKKYNTT